MTVSAPASPLAVDGPPPRVRQTVVAVLIAISFSHFLNDMVQSLIPAIYPMLKDTFHLNFAQVGFITLTYQMTASILQPAVGYYTDRRPLVYSLPVGMLCTLVGLLLLAWAATFPVLLLAAGLVGVGSAVFHPESSRVARLASGGQHGLAQSVFQLGGNAGSSFGPLLAAFIILPRGRSSVAWFSLATLLAILVLIRVAQWYGARNAARRANQIPVTDEHRIPLSRGRVAGALGVLVALVFSKYFYLVSLTSYYTFYLMDKFNVSVQSAQIYLFIFLGAVAAGTVIGGPIGDRIGRKYVIWVSILGVLPFTLLLPYANLFWTSILSVVIGVVLSSAFPAILVYGQELLPGNVGMISGLFFGLAFGMGGLGAALLGTLADKTSLRFVYEICAFLPAIGLLTGLLPDLG